MTDVGAAVSQLHDGLGYTVRPSDIAFLSLTVEQIAAFVLKDIPLGMDQAQYKEFRTSLRDALKSDGINDADVRLKGSSAHFFSGLHKRMPWGYYGVDREMILKEFWKERRETEDDISLEKLNAIVSILEEQWPVTLPKRPMRRPFDVMYRAGIHTEKSDYDLQISSHTIWTKACQAIVELGVSPTAALVEHETYAFINKKLFLQVCPTVDTWRLFQTKKLGRPVTVAAFPAEGPVDHSDTIGELSSHFRDDYDWILWKRGQHEPA